MGNLVPPVSDPAEALGMTRFGFTDQSTDHSTASSLPIVASSLLSDHSDLAFEGHEGPTDGNMRIHELIETCVEYVALEGPVGCSPTQLLTYLSSVDSNIDATYFAHIYTLLLDHPSTLLILTSYPIPSPDGTVESGNAPLPPDYLLPQDIQHASDTSALREDGLKGRRLAAHLAGELYKSSKEVIATKREMQEQKRHDPNTRSGKAQRALVDDNGAGPSGTSHGEGEDANMAIARLMWSIADDDGGEGENRLLCKDLPGMTAKWGSRLRIRCTDDEIYFRLTGTTHRTSKITPTVFHILQLTARSREHGITAIELGPLVGSSQGSMHHYMKVLTGMRLCVKMPIALHASMTNLFVFHRFLDQNETYCSLSGRNGPAPEVGFIDPGETLADGDDEGDDDILNPVVGAAPKSANEWGFDFSPMTESQLMAGHLIRERLVKLLDHPSLQSHLLRVKNLLPILGFVQESVLRHRRIIFKQIDALVEDGIVEVLHIGGKRIRCIRLAKYNSQKTENASGGQLVTATIGKAEEDHLTGLHLSNLDPALFNEPFRGSVSATITRTLEQQLLETIVNSDQNGITIADIHRQLGGYYRRAIEYQILRQEKMYCPPHLSATAICTVMEGVKRERRLRAFTVESFRRLMSSTGQSVDPAMHPPQPLQAGYWGNTSFRRFHSSKAEYDKCIDALSFNSGAEPAQALKTAGKRNSAQAKGPTGAAEDVRDRSNEDDDDSDGPPRPKRQMAYDRSYQIRGRPRKYIHVVNQDGAVNRAIIGSIIPRPELPSILVYVKEANKLVEAPPGYSGLGAPPAFTDENLAQGHPPSWYWQFNGKKPASGQVSHKTKEGVKKDKTGRADKTKGTKRPRKGDAVESAPPRRSKRAKAETSHNVKAREEIDELASSEADVQDHNEPHIVSAPAAINSLAGGEGPNELDDLDLSLFDDLPPDITGGVVDYEEPSPHSAVGTGNIDQVNEQPSVEPNLPIKESFKFRGPLSSDLANLTENRELLAFPPASEQDAPSGTMNASQRPKRLVTKPTKTATGSRQLKNIPSSPMKSASAGAGQHALEQEIVPETSEPKKRASSWRSEALDNRPSSGSVALFNAIAQPGAISLDAIPRLDQTSRKDISHSAATRIDTIPAAQSSIMQRNRSSGSAHSLPRIQTPGNVPIQPSFSKPSILGRSVSSSSTPSTLSRMPRAYPSSMPPIAAPYPLPSMSPAFPPQRDPYRKDFFFMPPDLGHRSQATRPPIFYHTPPPFIAPPGLGFQSASYRPLTRPGDFPTPPTPGRWIFVPDPLHGSPLVPKHSPGIPPLSQHMPMGPPIFSYPPMTPAAPRLPMQHASSSIFFEVPNDDHMLHMNRHTMDMSSDEQKHPFEGQPVDFALQEPGESDEAVRPNDSPTIPADSNEDAMTASDIIAQPVDTGQKLPSSGPAPTLAASETTESIDGLPTEITTLRPTRASSRLASTRQSKTALKRKNPKTDIQASNDNATDIPAAEADVTALDVFSTPAIIPSSSAAPSVTGAETPLKRRRIPADSTSKSKGDVSKVPEAVVFPNIIDVEMSAHAGTAGQDIGSKTQHMPVVTSGATAAASGSTDTQQPSAPSSHAPRITAVEQITTPSSRQEPSQVARSAMTFVAARAFTPSRPGRFDLQKNRRINELLQVLTESGGILEDIKLWRGHEDWTHRVAKTDHPHAPAQAYCMDRATFKRTVESLIDDGRCKRTTTSLVTSGGRWVRSTIVYLTGTAEKELQRFITDLDTAIRHTLPPMRTSAIIAPTAFTEVRLDGETKASLRQSMTVASDTVYSEPTVTVTRRDTLLKDAKVVSTLYGYHLHRFPRLQHLHAAIVTAIGSNPDSSAVLSTAPRIFALPLLLEDITVADWFACVVTAWYDAKLERYIKDPDTRGTKLRDMPKHLRPPLSFASSSGALKMRNLFVSLAALKVVTPLSRTQEPEGAIFNSGSIYYRACEDTLVAPYYLLHDLAPVYHYAVDPPSLLGLLPVREASEVPSFWDAIHSASRNTNINGVKMPEFHPHAESPACAKLESTAPPSLQGELYSWLQAPGKWKREINLEPVQREAIDAVIHRQTGAILIKSTEEYEQLAWDNALPRDWIKGYVTRRAEYYQERAADHKFRNKEAAKLVREKRDKAEESLRQKISDRQAVIKRAWEERVRAAASRVGILFEPGMVDYVTRQTLLSTRKIDFNDALMDSSVRLYLRSKQIGSMAEERPVLAAYKASLPQRVRAKPGKKRQPQGPTGPGLRRRKKWTAGDDELLIDMEAIIRVRSDHDQRGRNAMLQVFPGFAAASFLHRLKKVVATPYKKAYFDHLKRQWSDIWLQHRGTEALPDHDPESATDFDIETHINFFRARVNKPAARLAAALGVKDDESGPLLPELPPLVEMFSKENDWSIKGFTGIGLPVLYEGGQTEEGRFAAFSAASFHDPEPVVWPYGRDRSDGLIKAALKMIVTTPPEIYHQPSASDLLKLWSKDHQDDAVRELEDEKVIIKRKSNAETGRAYTFTAGFLQLSEGPANQELRDAAVEFEARFTIDQVVDWPLLEVNGEMAALLDMVIFDFDYNDFPTVKHPPRRQLYNTRAFNDDFFEFDLRVKRLARPNASDRVDPPSLQRLNTPTPWPRVDSDVGPPDMLHRVREIIQGSGSEGLIKYDLVTQTHLSPSIIDSALATLAAENPPCIFWAGYDTARVVPAVEWDAWTVSCNARGGEGALQIIPGRRQATPRKWVDIWGERIDEKWQKACRAVLAHIFTRPGISEFLLRVKLAQFLDRLEQNDVLQYLLDCGRLRRAYVAPMRQVLPPVEATDVCEEEGISWWPDEERVWR